MDSSRLERREGEVCSPLLDIGHCCNDLYCEGEAKTAFSRQLAPR